MNMRNRLGTALLAIGLGLTGLPATAATTGIHFALIDQNGAQTSEADFGDAYQLIYFGYTHCPDICPVTLSTMAVVLQKLPARLKDRVKFIFISGDPERDTPSVLKDYISSFDPAIVGLTGGTKAIDALAWSMKVVIIRYGAPTDKAYRVDHSAFFTLVHKGQIVGTLPDGRSPEEILARLDALIPN